MTRHHSGRTGTSTTRRTFLGSVAVASAALAGCAQEREPVVVETSIALDGAATDDVETVVDGERNELAAGEFLQWEFRLDEEADVAYRVDVVEGESVNAYVLEPEEYETLSEEESGFEAVPGTVSEAVTSTTNTTTLDAGIYTLVVMNAAITPENA
jgi:hypothetical protein